MRGETYFSPSDSSSVDESCCKTILFLPFLLVPFDLATVPPAVSAVGRVLDPASAVSVVGWVFLPPGLSLWTASVVSSTGKGSPGDSLAGLMCLDGKIAVSIGSSCSGSIVDFVPTKYNA